MSIVIFVVVLFLLVLVHEWGHFIVAKITGMRVDEFGIGFPPKLFGMKRGETEYTFNAIPIGGFVKIYGEDTTEEVGALPEANRMRAFGAKNKWAQAAVLLAGVTMNVLFAWFLFAVAFTIGVQTAVDETEASPQAQLMITGIVPDGPAAVTELPIGARITAVETETAVLSALTPSSFINFVTENGTQPIQISYTVGDEIQTTTITPRTGAIAAEPERVAIGISLSLIDKVSQPLHTAIIDGFFYTLTSLKLVAVGIISFFASALSLTADLSQVAGPIGIVGLVGEASAFGLTSLLMFTAFISLNLAVINVLPFPALDGGRLLFVIIEALKGSPIPPRYAATLNMIGFALLMLLMVVVTWSDIVKLI